MKEIAGTSHEGIFVLELWVRSAPWREMLHSSKKINNKRLDVGEKCIKKQIPKVMRGASHVEGDEKGIT